MKETDKLFCWGGVYKCPKCRQVSDWYIEMNEHNAKWFSSWLDISTKGRKFRCGNCCYEEMVTENMADHLIASNSGLPHLKKLKDIWGDIKSELLQQLYLDVHEDGFNYQVFITKMVDHFYTDEKNISKVDYAYACKKYLEFYYSVEV